MHAQRTALLLALASTSVACNPRSFDALTGGDASTSLGAQVPGRDAGMADGGASADAGMAVDAGSDAAPSDAGPPDASIDGGMRSRCESPLPVPGVAQIEEALELGVLPTPPNVTQRRGSVSARVGERLVWLFSETVIPGQASSYPTAVWGSADGAPEHAKQARLDEPKTTPVALIDQGGLLPIPGGLIARADGSLLVFYATYYIFTPVQAWVAHLDSEGFTATSPEHPLFAIAPEAPDAGDGSRWRPLFHSGAHAADGFAYVYACNPAPGEEKTAPCRLARAPLDDAEDVSAYRFYSGQKSEPWADDSIRAVAVIEGVATDLSVSYNAYLGQLLAVFTSAICPGQIELHVADKAEGPWTRIGMVPTRTPPAAANGAPNYRAFEHSALRSDKEDELVLSYLHYLEVSFEPLVIQPETRLVRIKLHK